MVVPVKNGLSIALQKLLNVVLPITASKVQTCFRFYTSSSRSNPTEETNQPTQWRCTSEIDKFYDMSESFRKSDEWTTKLLKSMLIYPNFVSLDEENDIMKEVEPYMKRLHYETEHWDDAIHNYRETERAKWNHRNTVVIDRIRAVCFPPGVPQLRFVHILDLEKSGVIKPHIDSVRFCGNTIAGLSLLSDSIMRLRHDVQKDFHCDVLLPRLSLYVMKDFSRYEFTHEILGENESKFKSEMIQRDRRISIICRNEPDAPSSDPVFQPLDS